MRFHIKYIYFIIFSLFLVIINISINHSDEAKINCFTFFFFDCIARFIVPFKLTSIVFDKSLLHSSLVDNAAKCTTIDP